jgi:hypothetical protein
MRCWPADALIHYQLCCDVAHEFDGWFKDSDNFDQQAARKLISCPVCASTKVRRALMAPGIRRKAKSPAPIIEAETNPPVGTAPQLPNQKAGGLMPDQLRSALLKLRADVEKNCDYVGPNFAEEARRIHNGESQPRGIYGESTEAEAEALADDGIEIAQIPWLPRADS